MESIAFRGCEHPIIGGKQVVMWPPAKDGKIICELGKRGLKADETKQASSSQILCGLMI